MSIKSKGSLLCELQSCSHCRAHEGQTVKFIKELSANIPCVNSTLELSSTYAACTPGSSRVFPRWAALRKRHCLCTLPRTSAPSKLWTMLRQSQFRRVWLSLTYPYLTSSSSHSSSWAQFVTAFLWENSIGSGLHQAKTRLFFLDSPSMRTAPSGPRFQHHHSKYTHMLRNGWTQSCFLPTVAHFPSVFAAKEDLAASSLTSEHLHWSPCTCIELSGWLEFTS